MFVCINGGLSISKEPSMTEALERQILSNIRAIPDKPLCMLLSGGIDSSLVLALVRKTYPQVPIHTFTIAGHTDYPDIIYARKVAEFFSTIHHEKIVTNTELSQYSKEYEQVRKHNFRGDINAYILCSIARKYSTVIVTGDGGDECFGGYWLHKYPLGHKETGLISCFDEIHIDSRKHLKEMVNLGFRDFFYKAQSSEADYLAVWEYFVRVLLPNHMEPLMNTVEILNLTVFTPLFSPNLIRYLRTLPIEERINRKIEKKLAKKYLPVLIIKRKSIGFDNALNKKIEYKL